MSGFIEKVVGDIGDKKRWREYEQRVEALPAGRRTAVEALQRYLLHRGAITKGDVLVDLHLELVGVFERASSDGTPVREVLGADPVQFADTLLSRYASGEWIEKGRRRLVDAIARAEAQSGSRS
ncbi:DUF1048 domain-containing protein [Kineococcus auxinigenes]|uniref:DUF1048 domain-containing protein n=1 Tax=unclassified Kineococcus TaxID=2621656 RepID=UPI003D7D9671